MLVPDAEILARAGGWHNHRDGGRQHRTTATTKTFLMFERANLFGVVLNRFKPSYSTKRERTLWPLWSLRPLWALREILEIFQILEIRRSRFERMTDGAFSLSPPGSFALSADPAFQDEVRRELVRLIERVRECVAAPSVAGVLLTGSFARGEGTVISNCPSGSRWLSDVECLVVVRNGIVPSQEIHRSMRQIERDANSDCGNSARGIKVELRAIFS